MKAPTGHKTNGTTHRFAVEGRTKRKLPWLAAIGGTYILATAPAAALELGDIRIESALGQPFRASIAYTLNPNEQLFDDCVYLRPGVATAGVPTLSRPTIRIDGGRIMLSGTTPIMEPVLAMQVMVNCPYTARLSREYTLMMSPAAAFEKSVATPAPVAATMPATPVQEAPRAPSKPVAEPPVVTAAKPTPLVPPAAADQPASQPGGRSAGTTDPAAPISGNSRYFVQSGDSLSAIARRFENRSIGLWPAVNAIFDANPQAFLNGDINQLIAATWIVIPDFAGGQVAADANLAADTVPTRDARLAVDQAAHAVADADSEFETAATIEPVSVPVAETSQANPAADSISATAVAGVSETAVSQRVAEPQPVAETTLDDAALAGDAESVVENTDEPVAAADTGDEIVNAAEIDANVAAEVVDDTNVLRPGDLVVEPAPAANARAVPVVSRAVTPADDGFSVPGWVMLLGGAVTAIAIAMFMFGRTLLDRFASRKAAEPALPDDVFDDEPTVETRIVDDVDFQFEDNTVSSQSISLDADLGAGTGLRDSADLDVAQDFGFSAANSDEVAVGIDLELPEEAAAEPEQYPTDIIEPSHRIEETLYAEETPAAGDTQNAAAIDDTEYDLSMIVDATKQQLGEDELTAKDLHAVRVDQDFGSQTLASEVDIAILEQDYEDEFTQTQALNDEIARAAEELALRMHEEDAAEITSQIEGFDDPAMVATAATPVEAGNDDITEISDLDDTGVNPQLTANLHNPGNEKTIKMPHPGSDKTVEMPNPGNEPTVEMANPGNDPTIEMQLESGAIDTKKPKAS